LRQKVVTTANRPQKKERQKANQTLAGEEPKSRRNFPYVQGICPDSAALAWLSNN
jgi:hypothetical protein